MKYTTAAITTPPTEEVVAEKGGLGCRGAERKLLCVHDEEEDIIQTLRLKSKNGLRGRERAPTLSKSKTTPNLLCAGAGLNAEGASAVSAEKG
mmetsp:Transcript_6293/g.8671  ORF Transcript_6293/g.8671 Transcript_6293/m.8671 type:complete len:93 (-) Transcript_6293:1073-1351(-)